MWIKICGMTTPEAVAAALDAGVDAIGFVFAKSVRQVTPEQAMATLDQVLDFLRGGLEALQRE